MSNDDIFTGATRVMTEDERNPPTQLIERYKSLHTSRAVAAPSRYELRELLGSGSQGVVYLADRVGVEEFRVRAALKFHSPEKYKGDLYEKHMSYVARVAKELAAVQQDHLLDIQNVINLEGIQVMVMEWVDGYDLRQLLRSCTMERLKQRVEPDRFEYVNDVVATQGPHNLRFKPGVAIAILRECLAGLSALHRAGIVHGDLKPANIMVKRTGNTKLVDFGSAFLLNERPEFRTWTPMYTAPEMMENREYTQFSDLASLGYIVIEMLSGVDLFQYAKDQDDLLERKKTLVANLDRILPAEISRDQSLMNLLKGMIQYDPDQRFPSADAADLAEEGAAEFQRNLVKNDLSSEYETEIRLWLEDQSPSMIEHISDSSSGVTQEDATEFDIQ